MGQQRLAVGIRRDHVAIMRKAWGLTAKLLTGKKTIETRWYKNKSSPWDQIFPGDRIFFKDSGEPVSVQAEVKRVEQFANLDKDAVLNLLNRYAQSDGLGIDPGSLEKFYHLFKNKRYCIVIHLGKIRAVKPFQVDKTGYGLQSAWLVTGSIESLKR